MVLISLFYDLKMCNNDLNMHNKVYIKLDNHLGFCFWCRITHYNMLKLISIVITWRTICSAGFGEATNSLGLWWGDKCPWSIATVTFWRYRCISRFVFSDMSTLMSYCLANTFDNLVTTWQDIELKSYSKQHIIIEINPAFSGIAFLPKISGKMSLSMALRRYAPSGHWRRHFPLDFLVGPQCPRMQD